MSQGPIFVFLCGNVTKHIDLTIQAIKFLKRTIPSATVGIITPPGGSNLKHSFASRFKTVDEKLDANEIHFVEGRKHFDDWNNSQYILDIELFAGDFETIVYLDAATVVLQDILPSVQSFTSSDYKFGFFPDIVNDYPNFKENWKGPGDLIPRQTIMLFKSANLPPLVQAWEAKWREWIEPAPFVNHKDPARFYKLSRLSIGQYALGQTLFETLPNFIDDVQVFGRDDLKIVRNLGKEAEKAKANFLQAGSSFSNEGTGKITIAILSGKVYKKQDLIGKGDPYVKLRVGDSEKRTKTKNNTQEPEWNETYSFEDVTYADAANVTFVLYDYDVLTSDEEIGTATLNLLGIKSSHARGRKSFTLPVNDSSNKEQAVLEVEAEYIVPVALEESSVGTNQKRKLPGKGGKPGRFGGIGAGRGKTRPQQVFTQPKKEKPNKAPALVYQLAPKSEAEKKAKAARWAEFASFLAKPYDKYPEKYKAELQALDAQGCINLKRITRKQFPRGMDLLHIALVAVNPYAGLPGELSLEQNGVDVVADGSLVANAYVQKGYKVAYLLDPTVLELTTWIDFLLAKVQKDLTVYLAGYGKKFLDYSLDQVHGEVQSCIVLYNEARKKRGPAERIEATSGATEDTVSEDFLFNTIAGLDYPQKKVTFYLDLYKSSVVFTDDNPDDKAVLDKLNSKESLAAGLVSNVASGLASRVSRIPGVSSLSIPGASSVEAAVAAAAGPAKLVPPGNTIVIDSLLDLDAALERDVGAGAGASPQEKVAAAKGQNTLATMVADPENKGFFSSLASFISQIIQFLTNSLSLVNVNYSPTTNTTEHVSGPVPPAEQDTPITEILDHLGDYGLNHETITELPPPTLSEVEKVGSEKRWAAFQAELKKPTAYKSKYKAELTQLDKLGAINLDRVTRSQFPDIQIDRAIALFFCPYEGLKHTLDAGPINDGITMAKLFIARGYKVLYMCDATPKEYYSWMDWILDTVHFEIVSYFSGHGTQTADKSGREQDGLSELLVFYDESKKTSADSKIKAQTGITENTISDDLMHELIISKQYPDTRVLLISDCCHSGTMFDFDEELDPALTRNKPPLNVVCIGAAKDAQTAKQTVLAGVESGVFTHNFAELETSKPATTFKELETYMNTKIKKYQDINITTSNTALLSDPIIAEEK